MSKRYRFITNSDELVLKLTKLGINYQILDFNGLGMKDQIQIAGQTSILASAHGQALWVVPFLPKESNVIEVLPYGFPYAAYKTIAATAGIKQYVQHTSLFSNITLPQATSHIRDYFKGQLGFEEAKIQELERELLILLRENNNTYDPIIDALEAKGADRTSAGVMGKLYAREQEITLDIDEFVGAILDAVLYQDNLCSISQK